MSKWQEKRLGEVVNYITRGITPKYTANGIKVINQKCIRDYKINLDFCKETLDTTNIGKKYVQYGDILINSTGTGTLGRVACSKIQNMPITFDSHVTLCRVGKEYNNFFIGYYLHSIEKELENFGCGSTNQTELNINDIKKIKINIPDLVTQEKMADILSTYDDLIENNNRRIDILEQMAQEIYKEWFVRFRFSGHEKVKFKSIKMTNWIIGDKTIFMIPYSWNIGNINELAIFQRGSNLTSANMINGNIPVISAGIQPSGYHNNANVFGQSITVSASGANAGYLLYHLNNIWASDCSYLQSEYIWFIYNTLKFLQPVLSNLQCGAAQPHVYPKQINKISIIIPTNEILKQYCSKVEPIYEYIKNLKEKNQNLIKQRDLLLPRLMSGKLEV